MRGGCLAYLLGHVLRLFRTELYIANTSAGESLLKLGHVERLTGWDTFDVLSGLEVRPEAGYLLQLQLLLSLCIG